MQLSIELADLEAMIPDHRGNTLFERALATGTTGEDLINLIANYIQFNSSFGSGVANLAGEIGSQPDLFQDMAEPLKIFADRSVEVASRILFAAVDEFNDSGTEHLDTHRTLAQAALKGIGQFFGYTPSQLNDIISINSVTTEAIEQVRLGYAISQNVTEEVLFRALGFHMGSEILADEEFRLIDELLKQEHPELVSHLERTHVEINGYPHSTYYWIRIHTTVEADHFASASTGVNLALQYYAGKHQLEEVRKWVLEGFATFASIQSMFMQGLLNSQLVSDVATNN